MWELAWIILGNAVHQAVHIMEVMCLFLYYINSHITDWGHGDNRVDVLYPLDCSKSSQSKSGPLYWSQGRQFGKTSQSKLDFENIQPKKKNNFLTPPSKATRPKHRTSLIFLWNLTQTYTCLWDYGKLTIFSCQ